MTSFHPYTLFPLGDAALTVSFGEGMDEGLHQKVMLLFAQLGRTPLKGVLNLVPAYDSLTVYYDVYELRQGHPGIPAFETVAKWIQSMPLPALSGEEEGRLVKVPVCYEGPYAPDMEELTGYTGLSREAVVELHCSLLYRVFMIGFLPGFAYMGPLDSRLAMPRRSSPRLSVPAGAVGIAGGQTGIYPLESPGGWQILGRTPLLLFDKDRPEPVFFRPGDRVQFYPITEDEFASY